MNPRGISMRLQAIVNLNTTTDVINDGKMVRDRSESQPKDCKRELTTEPINWMAPDRMQERSASTQTRPLVKIVRYIDRPTTRRYKKHRSQAK